MRLVVKALVGLAALAFVTPSFAKDDAAEATVVCKDGSSSKAGRGACRGHGGVDKAASAKAAGGAAAAAPAEKGKKAKESAEKAEAKAAGKADEKAAEATVLCKDGSTSKGGRGACRGHGGVDRTATAKGAAAAVPAPTPQAPPAAAAPPPAVRSAPPAPVARPATATTAAAPPNAKNTDPTGAIAKCKDGTYSHAKGHTGACSRHGGVEEWLDKK